MRRRCKSLMASFGASVGSGCGGVRGANRAKPVDSFGDWSLFWGTPPGESGSFRKHDD